MNDVGIAHAYYESERPAKRHKTQACTRCRRRKQKCDEKKPCSNCVRSNEECFEAPIPYQSQLPPIANALMPNGPPLARLADLAVLESRISALENRDTLSASQFRNATVLDTAPMDPPMQSDPSATPSRHEERTLTRSSPAMGLLSTFARYSDHGLSLIELHSDHEERSTPKEAEYLLDSAVEEALFNIYNDKVQCRYPFLRYHKLRDIKKKTSATRHEAFFLNMIFSIGLLLEKNTSHIPSSLNHQDFYRIAVTKYLSHVFAQPDQILHIQAYLMLAMHAVYSPSTERIITIASATMRYCVMAQLHSAAAEPAGIDAETKLRVQMRRRVFWCAYMLDRTVGATFDLPFSIPDGQITVKMYANINDWELEKRCSEAGPGDLQNIPGLTDVSAALHVVYCRQIQSEILNTTLHRDFNKYFNRHHRWRLRVLEKLDKWRSLCHRYTDVHSKNFTSSEWLNMIYNYSLAMLYQPTKASVLDSAGDWTVRACVQACLIFRKFQRETPITELWLGLIMQFKCGVALLYCFFATPPHKRSPVYELPDVAEAVRACSITLAIIAERWAQSRCLRDAFDILAREIPLFEPVPKCGTPEPRKIHRDSSASLLSLLKQLEPIVVHRETLRMIREVATEDFPGRRVDGPSELGTQEILTENMNQADAEVSPSWHTGMTEEFFQPFEPHLKPLELDGDDLESTPIGFPGDFDLTGLF